MIKKLLLFIALAFTCVCALAVTVMADTVEIEVDSSDGYDASCLTDDDYYSTDYYRTDTVLTVTSETPMEYLYIMWGSVPGNWTLTVNGKDTTCGENDFLHELVKLPEIATEAEITIANDRTYVADIYGIAGTIPDWVQDWEEPYEKADLLFISAHSDDEILFFGGAIPNYINGGNYRVQIAYLCDFALTESYRQHEQLNGLWAMGVTHYPQIGEFADEYPDDEDEIYGMLGYDNVVEYMVRTIRRFKPQVVVSHDFNGEYGHPEHRLTAEAVADAVDVTADPEKYSGSAEDYGTWDVPKTYFHLYPENEIDLDARVPLSDYEGRTALEVAAEAYKEHDSQQWMWFYVDDEYEYSCTRFGLYRSLVGSDTGNDMMEHLTSYDVQDEQAAETETTTEETASETTAETTVAPETTETTAAQTPAVQITEETTTQNNGTGTNNLQARMILIIILVVLCLIIVVIIVLLIASSSRNKKRRR